MARHNLGQVGPAVSAVGLGCMSMSGMYGPADRAESVATIHAALETGITLLDTGDFYGMGHNELLIREALAGRKRAEVLLSVKFGALRDPVQGWSGYDSRPAAIKNFLAYSLQRREQLTEALGALELRLSREKVAALTRAMPMDAVMGGRYAEAQMAHLDSEK